MTVYILLGSDDYISRHILDVYESRELAEQDITSEKHLLISRGGEPKREIVKKVVIQSPSAYPPTAEKEVKQASTIYEEAEAFFAKEEWDGAEPFVVAVAFAESKGLKFKK